jgi:hypothetical protein
MPAPGGVHLDAIEVPWIDRRHGRHGSGATPAAAAQPDLVATSLADFAAMALGS